MSRNVTLALNLACTVLMTATLAMAQGEDDGGIAGAGIPDLNAVRVATGVPTVLFATAAPGDLNRLFLLEQGSGGTGRIRLLDLTTTPPTLQATPYLSISGLFTGDERGLLGLAFHPDFANNGYFYVYYTPSGLNVVARYRANAPFMTSTSAVAAGTVLLSITDPFSNHNGGWIGFRPDDTEGLLYIGTGDGGSANDPQGNGQNINALLGKVLRLDIDGADGIPATDDDDGDDDEPDSTNGYTSPPSNIFFGKTPGRDEIWAYGLRNPWRNAFDRLTNDLYIADVGQNAWEEVNVTPAGTASGSNYGWRCMEGNACTGFTGCTCNDPVLTDPVHVYSHASGCSITGGYVYRGSAIPGLEGTYFFADYCSNQIWTFQYAGAVNPPISNRTAELAPGGGLSIVSITSFGEDAAGEIYICDQNGAEVFKIVPAPANDICANATAVSDGAFAFSTTTANSDALATHISCAFGAPATVFNDIWYDYTATCTGTATVSLCGANFNSRIIVYGGAACPVAATVPIVCNDNFCGNASEASWAATAGEHYRIRIGGFNFGSGSGTMVISCEAPPTCPEDVDGDGTVNVVDLLAVIAAWGSADPAADVNDDGTVNIEDLLQVVGGWGDCP
ncbi:MAG: PQQ-dependent sugar dehydrogenase [Phycisphaerales bacterium]|nr:PQQ-dependent sugar dehydrogenase [Phycisphaerales bacterium]